MSIADRYGLPMSTSSARAAEHYQDGMDRLLSYGFGADRAFAAAVKADEGFALAHAGAALFALFQGDAATARTAVDRARRLVAGATRREQQHVEALSAIAGGETARGLGLIEEHVKEFPRDALLVNQAASAIGLGGRADREQFRVGFVERLASAYGDDWWFQSALAFGYLEVGRYAESRRLSECSLEQYPTNARHAARFHLRRRPRGPRVRVGGRRCGALVADRRPPRRGRQGTSDRGHGGVAARAGHRRVRGRRLRRGPRPLRARREPDAPRGRESRPVGDFRGNHGRVPPPAPTLRRRGATAPPAPGPSPVAARSRLAQPGPIGAGSDVPGTNLTILMPN